MKCPGGRASRAAFPESTATSEDIIFTPLRFRHLTVKNRVFRSSISGRFDNEDGSLTQTRINWECKFAKGGVGAIISSYVPVADKGTDHHGLRHHPPRRFHPALADSARRPTNGGFLAPRAIPRPHHTSASASIRGSPSNGNSGHLYGTGLPRPRRRISSPNLITF